MTEQKFTSEFAEGGNLLERAGASEMFVEFVRRYPESNVASQVRFWIKSGQLADDNAEAGRPHSSGYFFDMLWDGNYEEAYQNADLENRRRLDDVL
ncbi:hypothetical protein ACFQGT_09810 [Natrialbaceae archaeon GCM10025810]|uniref:hypothetical protein n=1 Tax=Halovalidus salilacus TaxID=3075124 RepID=UPI003615B859